MSYSMPLHETTSSESSTASPAQTSPSYISNASTSLKREATSPPPNSRASSASAATHNHTSSFMLRSFISSLGHQGEAVHNASSSSSSSPTSIPGISSSSPQPSVRASGSRDDRRRKVVCISVQKSSVASDDFYQDKFISGDVVQRVASSEDDYFTSPFPTGKRGLLEELHSFHESGVSILTIQVKRGKREITRRALVVRVKKKKYVLQDFEDPSHIFSFDDCTLEDCDVLQAEGLRLAQEQLSKMRVAAVNVAYPWEQKMRSVNDFRMVYSMLVIPCGHADAHLSQTLSTLEDAVLQGMTWLHGSKASGVPLIFRSVQTEPIITEEVDQSSSVDLSGIASSSTYSLQQLQGFTERRVVIRALRIWFTFHVAEVKVELEARQDEGLLGVTIGRTIEGFCYVAEVVPQTAADRAGLKERLDAAKALGVKLVLTKVGNERVLPWFMSNGSIRCYDINSISSKLSAYRRARQAACLHILDVRDLATTREFDGQGLSMTSLFEGERASSSCME